MVANTIELPLKSLIVSAEEDFSKVTINPESQRCLKEKKRKPLDHRRLYSLVLEAAATASKFQLHTTVAVITYCKAGDLDSV